MKYFYLLFMVLLFGAACKQSQTSSTKAAVVSPEALEGFSGDTAFEIVEASVSEKGYAEHWLFKINHLYEKDNLYHQKARHLLDKLTYVSFLMRSKDRPYFGTLVVHGCVQNGRLHSQPCEQIRVDNFDFRKFLFPHIVAKGAAPKGFQCLQNLQAHLSEFARRSRIISRREKASEQTSQRSLGASFLEAYSKSLKDPYYEIRDKTKIVLMDTRSFVFTNNCREPGNYELALTLNESFFKGHIFIPKEKYNRILKAFTNGAVDIASMGTGERCVKNQALENMGKRAQRYTQLQAKNFPQCNKNLLSHLHTSTMQKVASGPLRPELGRLQYPAGSDEASKKSNYLKDSIVFLRVGLGSKPPDNKYFREAFAFFQKNKLLLNKTKGPVRIKENFSNAEKLWAWARRQTTPYFMQYRYPTYQSIYEADIAFSAFEVDGLYLSRDLSKVANTGDIGIPYLYEFNLSYLRNLNRYEVYRNDEGFLSIHLRDKSGAGIAIGNLKAPYNGGFLLGIGEQHLASGYAYDLSRDQKSLRYALAYDKNGILLDHHPMGIEFVIIFIRNGRIDIHLFSYERILPVFQVSFKHP